MTKAKIKDQPVDLESPRMLKIDNFSEWLVKKKLQIGTTTLSQKTGMSGKKINSYIQRYEQDSRSKAQGVITHVSIDTVDRTVVRLGGHISEIYPDYYDWPASSN